MRHPDPLRAAHLAIGAGADGITAHLREDRRHISDADIARLKTELTRPLNLEMAATAEIVQKMRPYSMGSINALVKHGGAASLKDTAAQAEVKSKVMALRKKTTSELNALGYETLPSETNFFMVSIGREVVPVIEEFRKKGVAVGRPFPPMTTHMRVSIGTAEEMDRFMKAFKEIFPAKSKTTAGV